MSNEGQQNGTPSDRTNVFNSAAAAPDDTLFEYLTNPNAPDMRKGESIANFFGRSTPRGSLAFLKDNEGFKLAMRELAADPNFDTDGDFDTASMNNLEGIYNRINTQNPAMGQALNTALSNPEFIKRIASGQSGELLNEDTINGLLNGKHSSYATQLLTQIGTNPIFRGDQAEASFNTVDGLVQQIKQFGEETAKLDAARTEAERTQHRNRLAHLQTAMTQDMRGLGVNVPEDVSPEILDAFKSIFLHGVPTAQAMDELMIKLAERGIDPEAIRSMDAMMRPMAGMMDFIAQPYGEFFRKHGSSIGGFFNDTVGHADNINRGILNGEGFVIDPQQRRDNAQSIINEIHARNNPQTRLSEEANANGFQAEATVRGEGLEGVEQRVDTTMQHNGAANDDTPQGINPVVADQQLNQTRTLGMGVGGP